jgi:hypothetical protein
MGAYIADGLNLVHVVPLTNSVKLAEHVVQHAHQLLLHSIRINRTLCLSRGWWPLGNERYPLGGRQVRARSSCQWSGAHRWRELAGEGSEANNVREQYRNGLVAVRHHGLQFIYVC